MKTTKSRPLGRGRKTEVPLPILVDQPASVGITLPTMIQGSPVPLFSGKVFTVSNPPIAGVDYELKLPPGKNWLSWTMIDTYLKCPERFRRTYIEGVGQEVNSALFQGSILTAVLEQIGLAKIKKLKKLTKAKEAIALHRKYMRDGIEDKHALDGKKLHVDDVKRWDDTTPDRLAVQNEILLEIFYNKEYGDLNPTGVEEEVLVEFAGVPFHTWVDLVEPEWVWDYKTTGSGGHFLNADKSLQLMLGCVALWRPKRGYIIFDKKTKDVYQKRAKEPLDLDQAKQWVTFTIATIARAISLGAFTPCSPAENFLCSEKWCQHWGDCYGKEVLRT